MGYLAPPYFSNFKSGFSNFKWHHKCLIIKPLRQDLKFEKFNLKFEKYRLEQWEDLKKTRKGLQFARLRG